MDEAGNYTIWLRKRIQKDTGFGILALPILGWIFSILMFSIIYPIMYLIDKND